MRYKAIFDIPDNYKIGCAVAKIAPDDGKVRCDSEFENAYADTVPISHVTDDYTITIEKLMNIVHNYTDPIRIHVVIGDARLTCDEANRMHEFYLTERYTYTDKKEHERLLKYYKDVPVWNLTVWTDYPESSPRGRTIHMGIQAHCYYKDIREGWLAEKADIKREKQREYRRRKKERSDDV